MVSEYPGGIHAVYKTVHQGTSCNVTIRVKTITETVQCFKGVSQVCLHLVKSLPLSQVERPCRRERRQLKPRVVYIAVQHNRKRAQTTPRRNIFNLVYMSKFKVGDKVRMKKDCSGNKAGQVYEVHYGTVYGFEKDRLYAWNETTTDCGCSCQDKWELVEEPITLENMSVGTIINSADRFRKVLAILGGEGELKVYILSQSTNNIESEELKKAAYCYTVYELQKEGYSVYQEEEVQEMTVEAVSKLVGKKVKIVE